MSAADKYRKFSLEFPAPSKNLEAKYRLSLLNSNGLNILLVCQKLNQSVKDYQYPA